jgi:hypothetical protein
MPSQTNSEPGKIAANKATLFDRTFRDSDGNIAIAQAPNLPILVWLGATALQLLPVAGKAQTGLSLIAFGALFTWAWLEIFEGVNYFRQALGLIVLIGVLALRINLGGV